MQFTLRRAQMEVYECEKRFRVLVAGRRFGKTHLALVELLRAAQGKDRVVWYVAPSYRQAKRIAWERLKSVSLKYWGERPNETDLSIRLKSGSTIAVRGADNYDSLRGEGLDFVVLDEYASMRPECWTEVLRPALSDRQGGALFIGTPQGFNHFYERFEQAQDNPEWAAFQFTTLEGGNVSAAELASAARELDERCFQQEFEAKFESVGRGLAYHAFERAENVRAAGFRAGEPLIWALDFNVDPMCSVLAQRDGESVWVLDEMALADANTLAACEAMAERTARWRGRGPLRVEVYGDASGNQRRTSGTDTDWGLIRQFFVKRAGEFVVTVRAVATNPSVRDRVNSVNARLRNASGERRLFIDPRCRELIRDFERVRWELDATGRATNELDKSDRARTHLSDALGYYVTQAFSLGMKVGERRDGRLW